MRRPIKLASDIAFEHRFPFFYGWVVLGVAALGVFMSGPAQTYGVAVFIDPMLAELGWTRSVISGSYSLASIIAGLSMLFFGQTLDQMGTRRVVTLLAILYGGACFGMAAIAEPVGLLIGFIALRVFGQASLVLACTTLAARWFVRRRGRAMSITVLGMALSNAAFPPALQVLVGTVGWRSAWIITGLVIWAILIVPAALLIRERPEALGLEPDGGPGTDKPGRKTARSVEYIWTFRQAVRGRTFWLLVVATVAPGTVMTGLVFHQISFFAARGLSAELAAVVLSVYAVAFAAMTFIVGFVLEQVPERYVLIAGLLLLPVTVLWLMMTTTPLQAVIYGVLLGIVLGTNSTTSSVLWAAYYGRQYLGSIRGVTQAAVVVSAATGPLLLSVPYDLLGSYTPGLWLMVGFPLVCAGAAALAGPPVAPPGADTNARQPER